MPTVRGVRVTESEQHVRRELVYTAELLRAMQARLFYRQILLTQAAHELGLTYEQAKTARNLARKRFPLVKEEWAVCKPELVWTEHIDCAVKPESKAKPRDTQQGPRHSKLWDGPAIAPDCLHEEKQRWSDELVRWARAQHAYNRVGATAIHDAVPGVKPAIPTVASWLARKAPAVDRADLQLFDYQVIQTLKAARMRRTSGLNQVFKLMAVHGLTVSDLV